MILRSVAHKFKKEEPEDLLPADTEEVGVAELSIEQGEDADGEASSR